jgi:FkbM family methyltransferase
MKSFRKLLKERLGRRLGVPTIPFALERIKQAGYSPRHVFDVGAYKGEFAALCLDLWPDTSVTCFEVLPQPLVEIGRLAGQHHNLRLIPCLLGASCQDKVEFHLAETGSSVLVENAVPQKHKAIVPMRTVDDVVSREPGGPPPDFLKMDVQGYELEVLKGAVNSLKSMSLVLAEVNLLDLHKNVPLLADLVGWMSERGWVAYDICGLTRRPLDHALWQADMIFVPSDSPLRADKHWK